MKLIALVTSVLVLLIAGCSDDSSAVPENERAYSFDEIRRVVGPTGCYDGLTLNTPSAIESLAEDQPVASNPSRTAGVTYNPENPTCYERVTEALKALP